MGNEQPEGKITAEEAQKTKKAQMWNIASLPLTYRLAGPLSCMARSVLRQTARPLVECRRDLLVAFHEQYAQYAFHCSSVVAERLLR